jgi:hypothetical protein
MRLSSAFSFAFVGLFLAACAATPDAEPAGDTTSAVSTSTSPFASAEKKLFGIFAGGPQRGGDVYSVESTHPIEDALKGYVKAKYSKDDPDALKNYKYKTNSNTFETDTQEAGTVSNSTAWSVIENDIDQWEDGVNPAKAKAKAAFDDLVQQGAVFGYDGFEESGCAAPTDFLLVIDPKGKKVYTIELTPCDES